MLLFSMTCFLISSCESGKDERRFAPGSEFSQSVVKAIQDLSGRLNIQPDDIETMEEKSITWRDGSLGCPKEGMMYTQALVEGTLIVLRADNKNYHYHAAQGRDPFYCENPAKSAPKSSSE